MRDNGNDPEARLREAAEWYAELQDREAGDPEWQAFLAWERDPANAAAFRRIEASLPAIDRASAGPANKRTRQQSRRRALLWGGSLTAVAAAAGLFAASWIAPAPHTEIYQTAIGEQKAISLTDGTVITLNTGTQLEVIHSDKVRHVRLLQGQALFEVSAARAPFIVSAAGYDTRALGTAFDIYLSPQGLSVSLKEGAVSIGRTGDKASASGQIVLSPGQQALAGPDGLDIRAVGAGAIGTWRGGEIRFDSVPLAQAIAEINRYSPLPVHLSDERLAGERISGVFQAGDAEVFAATLALYLPVEIERSESRIVITARGRAE